MKYNGLMDTVETEEVNYSHGVTKEAELCPYCNCYYPKGLHNIYLCSYARNDATSYCPLCEKANRKIEKAIEILKLKDLAPTCRAIKALEVLERD